MPCSLTPAMTDALPPGRLSAERSDMGPVGTTAFAHYVGVDYSGAQTPTSSLKGLRVYAADQTSSPIEVQPGISGAQRPKAPGLPSITTTKRVFAMFNYPILPVSLSGELRQAKAFDDVGR